MNLELNEVLTEWGADSNIPECACTEGVGVIHDERECLNV